MAKTEKRAGQAGLTKTLNLFCPLVLSKSGWGDSNSRPPAPKVVKAFSVCFVLFYNAMDALGLHRYTFHADFCCFIVFWLAPRPIGGQNVATMRPLGGDLCWPSLYPSSGFVSLESVSESLSELIGLFSVRQSHLKETTADITTITVIQFRIDFHISPSSCTIGFFLTD